ncbi:MAG: hypothetical protein J5656_01055 [Clostridia bacterium]|nr:hypothetical protein [Clostridia bacterium]
MKTASKIMYTIGRIFNIIAIIACVILIVVGIVAMVAPGKLADASDEIATAAEAKAMGISILITGVVLFVVYTVICAIAGHAKKALNNNKTENAPHILMIIVGIFGDIFYLLGGIFGLVAEHQN